MTLKALKIVRASLKDSHKLLEIGRQTFYDAFAPLNTKENIQQYLDEKFTLENVITELKNPNTDFYFVLHDHKKVGYLKLNTADAQTEINYDKALEIERIYVIKEHQGKKIGQCLLHKAIQIAQEKMLEYIWLGVWEKNTAAIRFYEGHGFTIFNKHQFALGSDIQTDLMMKLEL